ncbi:hypothetical protein BDZ89DRAFT_658896 [Hymenopellis radicata]|nr:hypothetical protein BDZ89DRAFT_658896 [Hymenopellis radicata]
MTATTSTRTSLTTTHVLLSSPIGALPAELLIEIFTFSAATNALIPLTLREVCTLWNEVVTASPHVWQVILLDDGARSVAASQKQTELWIERSAPLMFDIQLNVSTPDHLLPLLSPCLPHLSRWRQIVLTGQREEEVTISDLQMVSLDHLLISVGPEDDDMSEFIPKSTFVEYSPLWPGVMAMNVWLGQLPSSHTIPGLRFTTINITEQSLEIHLPAQSILDFLSACPHARTVSFAGFVHTDEAYAPSGTVVNLPDLTSLTLKTTSLTRSILSALDAPKLSELYLSLLNVDIELPTSDAYEDGDSDDEAQDFSLSPSSDRATGMGFRKLLARCNPPIRVLEMNFSDMRTKDFRHVFKRLKSLEDFVIVASDMSDTVINLFQDCLPMLRRIELYSCHRFNGETIIDVLRTRRFAPLDEVVISGCDGFSGNHAQVLFKELGNKFKDD